MHPPIVRKAVFPVAGLGTRFLPATKANPKEMLAIVDKPLIQYAVEEAVAAGITELIFVTSSAKRAIEDHFDVNIELEYALLEKGKKALLPIVQNIVPEGVSCIYVRQARPLGLGHAVQCAREIIGNEPFAVLLADDLIEGHHRPCLQQMLNVFDENGHSIIAVEPILNQDSTKYGIIDYEGEWEGLGKISSIVEKPEPIEAPSNLGVVGRYIFTPEIFECFTSIKPGSGGEIQLTDAIDKLIGLQPVLAYEFDGLRYDCGSKLGFLKATLNYGLKHPSLGRHFREYLLEEVCPKLTMKTTSSNLKHTQSTLEEE